ncbi:terminase gpA endonuclease subunit [Oceaniradius stylonematis]|uniref:terminase gpA endonuclease subunit n=1 Tax=Oceaniradius stylonematis TaxID=2184161 RepID=UPI003B5CC021
MPDTDWRRFLPDVPPPPFAAVEHVLRDALPALRTQRRIDVADWAEANRRLVTPTFQGNWSNDFAPYMTEPQRLVTSRRYGAGVFVGPARTAKSESLIQNTIGHAIDCKPRDLLCVCQTQDAAKQFSQRKFKPMLRANPNLAAKQSRERGADNIHEKRFAGGMTLIFGWPVIGFFSQNEFFTVLLTDRDRMPDDIDGEGDPFVLARKRVQHAGSLGMVISESSPGRLIEADDWEPATVHEAPPCAGILGEYNLGTRGRYYWECPHCHERFMPVFDALHWDEKSSPGESAKTVCMVCPQGCVIGPDRKQALNKAGIWLHEAADGSSLVDINDPSIRDTDVASWWCEGPVAAMQSWEQLVLRELQARAAFEERGDETALKATINLDQGRPYLPRVRTIGDGLALEAVKAMTKRFPMGIAPAETRFITVQVDVQQSKFVVSVEAWGVGLEHWLIDRFDVTDPPDSAPGSDKRSIDPGRFEEDFDALRPLLDRPYPVSGSGLALLPRAQIVDSGGAPGVTSNAYAYERRMRRHGYNGRVFLAKGQGGVERQRAVYAAPEKVLGTRRKRTTDIRIVHVGTDPLKDEIALALTRKEPGPNAYHLPEALPESVLAEFCAEVRGDKGWQLRKSGLRNEALDLAVYARALSVVLKAERIDWQSPPVWALPVHENSYCMALPDGADASEPAKPAAPRRRGRRVLSRGV